MKDVSSSLRSETAECDGRSGHAHPGSRGEGRRAGPLLPQASMRSRRMERPGTVAAMTGAAPQVPDGHSCGGGATDRSRASSDWCQCRFSSDSAQSAHVATKAVHWWGCRRSSRRGRDVQGSWPGPTSGSRYRRVEDFGTADAGDLHGRRSWGRFPRSRGRCHSPSSCASISGRPRRRCSRPTGWPACVARVLRWCRSWTTTPWPLLLCRRTIPTSGSPQPRRAPGWRNEVTLRSLEYFRGHEPTDYIPEISPTPLLMVVAPGDRLVDGGLSLRACQAAVEPRSWSGSTVGISTRTPAPDSRCHPGQRATGSWSISSTGRRGDGRSGRRAPRSPVSRMTECRMSRLEPEQLVLSPWRRRLPRPVPQDSQWWVSA